MLGPATHQRALERRARACIAAGTAPLDDDTEGAIAQRPSTGSSSSARLQPLLDDERIENIIANGCDQVLARVRPTARSARARPIAGSDDEMIEMIREIGGRGRACPSAQFDPADPKLEPAAARRQPAVRRAWVCARARRCRIRRAPLPQGHPRRPGRPGTTRSTPGCAELPRRRRAGPQATSSSAARTERGQDDAAAGRWPARSRPTSASSPSRRPRARPRPLPRPAPRRGRPRGPGGQRRGRGGDHTPPTSCGWRCG